MASIVRFLHSLGLHTYAFLVALFMQQTLRYTPFQAGLMALPGAVIMRGAGLLVGRHRRGCFSRYVCVDRPVMSGDHHPGAWLCPQHGRRGASKAASDYPQSAR